MYVLLHDIPLNASGKVRTGCPLKIIFLEKNKSTIYSICKGIVFLRDWSK